MTTTQEMMTELYGYAKDMEPPAEVFAYYPDRGTSICPWDTDWDTFNQIVLPFVATHNDAELIFVITDEMDFNDETYEATEYRKIIFFTKGCRLPGVLRLNYTYKNAEMVFEDALTLEDLSPDYPFDVVKVMDIYC